MIINDIKLTTKQATIIEALAELSSNLPEDAVIIGSDLLAEDVYPFLVGEFGGSVKSWRGVLRRMTTNPDIPFHLTEDVDFCNGTTGEVIGWNAEGGKILMDYNN